MAEMILPGVYVEVRPEGLIVPGRVTVGNVGVVGTASKGPIDTPIILGSYTEAQERFGDYDAWIDPSTEQPRENALSLVRALQLAYDHGATTVFAVRACNKDSHGNPVAEKASYTLKMDILNVATLTAKTAGTWGDDLTVDVSPAEEPAVIQDEEHSGGADISLDRAPVVESARNRITLFTRDTGITRRLEILYAGSPAAGEDPPQVVIEESGALTFPSGEEPTADDTVTASYLVAASEAVKVTVALGQSKEEYTIVDGDDLAADINQFPGGSAWVDAEADATSGGELPDTTSGFAAFSGGTNGKEANQASYREALDTLLNEPVHIMVAAGQDDTFGADMDAHCQIASSDALKRERIGVIGCALTASIDDLRGHALASDRIIFAAPGINTTDGASGQEVTLPGSYAAAAVAGLLAGYSAHRSPTNKTLSVRGLQHRYTAAQLTQLVQNRVLALEERLGFRIVKGITTATNTAWHQITTRRIVDYAKFGVRSACNPYIGLLNNERVRGAMRATINSFLAEMVDDEMLISYELDVTATRDEERKGIARVTIVLRPVFSIDFIKVTMFLE